MTFPLNKIKICLYWSFRSNCRMVQQQIGIIAFQVKGQLIFPTDSGFSKKNDITKVQFPKATSIKCRQQSYDI